MSDNKDLDLQRRVLMMGVLGGLAMPAAYANLDEASELSLFDSVSSSVR